MAWQDNPEIRNISQPEGGRVETGVTRFGDDWPGVFIRGDTAFYYAHCLRQYMESATPNTVMFMLETQIKSLIEDLESCNVMNL